ncbi:MAG: aminotransferase class I/II-fold pyridoxal phosphate-dependent enzyme [Planctomycetota bacterium]|nr:aminotransferase class I/II-fold pyridoxal phosphate-dependent enzyme [Planctomycetota bacterium]
MLADRVSYFTESVIREMSRLAARFGAINLAQGMPDFETPQEIKEAACKAIHDGFNQYAVTWGAPALRQAIAVKAKAFNGISCEPDKHVTVCCGATEAMMATMLAVVNPGDEVIVFQPFYENYGPDGLLSGAKPVYVHLREPDWHVDLEELAAAFTPKTKAIIINTPGNPTGKVFTRVELQFIADLCIKHDVLALTDEIYEHIIYGDPGIHPHISIATLPGMAERTVTISGLSKTFSVTGWRLGYCIAPEEITAGIRRVHDFLTVGAPHPLQMAGAAALALPTSYYAKLKTDYTRRRDILLPYLRQAGLKFEVPQGAYYVMTDAADLGATDDTAFVRWMVEHVGVAGVPGGSFYNPKSQGRTKVRFMWAKKDQTLHDAGERLLKMREEALARK